MKLGTHKQPDREFTQQYLLNLHSVPGPETTISSTSVLQQCCPKETMRGTFVTVNFLAALLKK